MKQIICMVVVFSFLVCFFAGCRHSADNTQDSKAGNTEVKRIVALNPADVTNLAVLGCLDMLVGRGEFCKKPESIRSLPQIGTGPNTNTEEILALKPDLVIMSTMNQSEDHARVLERAGVRVLINRVHNIEQVCDAMLVLAEETGRLQQGKAAVEDFRTRLEALKEKSLDAPFRGRTVYYEVSPLREGLWAAASETFLDETGTLLGLVNILAGKKGWVQVSEEQVINRNPDYIITLCPESGDPAAMKNEICSRKGWERLGAVKNNRVIVLPADKLSQPSMILAEGAEELADRLAEAE